MVENRPSIWSYTGSPREVGVWMRTVTLSERNCVVQTITLKRDCQGCPITSPYGTLTNHSEATSVVTKDSTFVWSNPTLQNDEKCAIKMIQNGAGSVVKSDKESFKLTDEANELELHYERKEMLFCGHKFHRSTNINGAYVELPDTGDKKGLQLYNKLTN